MAEEWNCHVLNLLKDLSKDTQLSDILQKYRFKTSRQLKTFKKYLQKKLLARESLQPYQDQIRKLNTLLRQNDIQPQAPCSKPQFPPTNEVNIQAVDADADNHSVEDETPVVPRPKNRSRQGSARKTPAYEENPREHACEISTDLADDAEFCAWVLDSKVSICPACLGIQKNENGFVNGHNGRTCSIVNRPSTEQERKAMESLKKRIKKRNK